MWPFWTYFFLSVIFGIIGYLLRWLQHPVIYTPHKPSECHAEVPSISGLTITNYESLAIKTRDGAVLRGFIAYPQNEVPDQVLSDDGRASSVLQESTTSDAISTKDCVLVYFHGNAGNVDQKVPVAALLMRALSCPVVMVDYRGYGKSSGGEPDLSSSDSESTTTIAMRAVDEEEENEASTLLQGDFRPSERGLKTDAHTIVQFVIDHILPKHCPSRTTTRRVIVMGQSLGGAVSIYLCAHRKYEKYLAALVLENTFTSLSDILDIIAISFLVPHISSFPSLARSIVLNYSRYILIPYFLLVGWNSVKSIPNVTAPTLFLSGLKDEKVPPWQMEALHAAAKSSALRRLSIFAAAGHSDVPGQQGYGEVINTFVNEALQRSTQKA